MLTIDNIFQINDWKLKKFLSLVLSIQVILLGSIILPMFNIRLPFVTEVIGFIYLTFVPGFLILRILKIHDLSSMESISYAMGLSLTALMIIGFSSNLIYPILGINKPLSPFYLILTMTIFTIILCIISYFRDDGFHLNKKININPVNLFILLLPFIAIIGTFFMNYYQNNFIMLLFILIISIIPLLVVFGKIKSEYYPLAIFVVSLALLFHRSLISQYVWGWDINFEYYYASIVLNNSLLSYMSSSTPNSMLSVVIIAPFYSIFTNISLNYVFKVIYPFIYSFVPLILYQIYKKQTSAKIAFLACFFFVSVFVFYEEMPQLAKQQIAELFFVLLLLLIVDAKIEKIKKSILFLIFAVSLIVSHYGLTYIFILMLVISVLILSMIDNSRFEKIFSNIKHSVNSNSLNNNITLTFLLFFVTFTLAWYIYLTSSLTFISLVSLVNKISSGIFTDIFNVGGSTQGLSLIQSGTSSLFSKISKYIHLLSQFFISFALIMIIMGRSKFKFDRIFLAFIFSSFIILLAGIFIPYFGSSLNTSRLYHISLLIIAPMFVIGLIMFLQVINDILGSKIHIKQFNYHIVAVFIMVLFLFNTGFIYQIVGESSNISFENKVDYPIFNDKDVASAKWINNLTLNTKQILYADDNAYNLFAQIRGTPGLLRQNISLPRNSVVYADTRNIVDDRFQINGQFYNKTLVQFRERKMFELNKIYDNGGSQIFFNS
ncbi:DUF2206 domain-containing protein [Methanobacterium sp.]|uniref:DUF2206 domain-containing protein n=1 Tax=Methanobacterium sp. TaxID=2164 RepID=UPI0025FF56FC|nr:DUF2206 domain-containing protein [Methanobacterium sp.]MBI5459241.1 DUF2206 domain-containing protein [Methanobacterium sp.]